MLSLQLCAEIVVLVVLGTDVIVDGVHFFREDVDDGGEWFVGPVFDLVPRKVGEVLVKGFCDEASVRIVHCDIVVEGCVSGKDGLAYILSLTLLCI